MKDENGYMKIKGQNYIIEFPVQSKKTYRPNLFCNLSFIICILYFVICIISISSASGFFKNNIIESFGKIADISGERMGYFLFQVPFFRGHDFF